MPPPPEPSVTLLMAVAAAGLVTFPMTAEIAPFISVYPDALSVPLAMVPPVSVTRPVFWATPPRSKVPPLTLMTPVRNSALAWTSASVPAVTLVPPV